MYICLKCEEELLKKAGIKPEDYGLYLMVVLNEGDCEFCSAKEVKVDWISEKDLERLKRKIR